MKRAKRIYLRSPAKINRSLVILGKRNDGFHELLTEMVMIDLFDEILLERIADPGIHLRMSGRLIDGEVKDNLVNRALGEFGKAVSRKRNEGPFSGGFSADLTKQIPVGAGLGGGSSNAATVLWGANYMEGEPLDREELVTICRSLGSDVPFFLGSPRAMGVGKGDLLHPLPPSDPEIVLLWNPELILSTASVYRSLDPTTFPFQEPCELTENERSVRINGLLNSGILVNSLEAPARKLCPKVGEGLEYLQRVRPGKARMTGSGPTVFALFESMEEADLIRKDIQKDLGGWAGVYRVLSQPPFPWKSVR